jgi:hypothetical protein
MNTPHRIDVHQHLVWPFWMDGFQKIGGNSGSAGTTP